MKGFWVAVWLGLFAALAVPASVQAEEELSPLGEMLEQLELYGFWETRMGARTQNDPEEKDISIAETRLQLEAFTSTENMDFKYRGDIRGDLVADCVGYETREAWAFARPYDFLDVKAGRQILTWGTGGLVFLNDLFPKDWQSFFIGRDAEYLKAPTTSVKVGLFSDVANVDLVYTPKFESDRYINGEYISYWDASRQGLVGNDNVLKTDTPDRWLEDDEFAARIYRNIDNYELALYLYRGFWKSPNGVSSSGKSIFPELNAYGGSIRGAVGPGIGNLEFVYYHSPESRGGENAFVRNSEMRYLVGYAQEVWQDFNANIQYYVEHMLDYDEYREQLTSDDPRDEFRHVMTLQLTQLLMNQNLTLSLDTYYSPSDNDAYLRPNMSYKVSDTVVVGLGANIFMGESQSTFFGQFEKNTNIFTSFRYSF